MKMKTLAASVFAIGMFSAIPATVSAVVAPLTLSFSPVAQNTTIGGGVSVDIIATLDNQILSNYSLLFKYNPAIVQLTGFTLFDAPFGGLADSLSGFDANTAGQVDFSTYSLLSDADVDLLQGTSVTLAHLEFTGIAAGTSLLSFDFTDANRYQCVGFASENLPCGEQTGSITVAGNNGGNTGGNNVPEPAGGVLAFTALGALALARRYRS